MATGSADIAARAKVSDFRTLPLFPSQPPSLHVSLFLSPACQYTSTCLMGPSEELTADMLVSLFPPAILLELALVISHATDKQLRPQHLRNPPSTPPHDGLSLQRRSRQGLRSTVRMQVDSISQTLQDMLFMWMSLRYDALINVQQLERIQAFDTVKRNLLYCLSCVSDRDSLICCSQSFWKQETFSTLDLGNSSLMK